MRAADLSQFEGHKYLNIETYKRSGEPVRTPVWFAQEGEVLYIYSLAEAGKVKRIRNNPKVRIAPCDMRGNPRGNWIEAKARIESSEGEVRGHRLLDNKYGLLKRIGNIFSRLTGRKRVVISIGDA
jgi:PPOX class probable F420-dependent enzyme